MVSPTVVEQELFATEPAAACARGIEMAESVETIKSNERSWIKNILVRRKRKAFLPANPI